ncbi:Ig-like domain-containing protein [Arthrobacter sp. ISL-65]|uniref:Ig-like domain-containing protein n=1 Tax=Arthrobacter sp. ISL-65 TaxID=2819112 RepID=UPI0027E15685|nr:Ig-like domain-containing protein [Arthrobacter sp. ISL-65]
MSIPIQADVQLREATLLGKTTFHRGGPGRGRLRGSRSLWLHALLTALLLTLGVLVVPVTASAAAGDVGVEDFSHSGTGTPTGTKRQTNALWFNDGIWWGNLWDTASSDFHIFRFNAATSSWVNTGVATETRANTHHDVMWDGTTLFVASYRFVNDGLPFEPNFPSTMRRYSYDSGTKTYTLLTSERIHNNKVETMSIDKDSTGRVWATWQQGNRIFLNVTDTDGITWGTPFAHPASLSNVSVDDTSAVIAFGGAGNGKMGVMWSRQVGDATDGMYWSFHVDGASNTTWTTPVAAVKGLRSGDDHMNLKWLDSTGGQVFAATKTSNTSASLPLIQLLVLNATTSTWSAHTIATVSECPNRVIVMIDEFAQRLRTFATYPKPSGTTNAGVCTSSGGAVYEKSTSLSNISFTTTKTARIVDADQYMHNVTSTKQNLNSNASGTANSGLLVLADVNATSRYWHYYDSTGGGGGTDTTAPTVTGTSPAAGAPGVATTANVTGTFSEAMDPSTVTSSTFTLEDGATTVPAAVSYSSTDGVATLNPGANLAVGRTYTVSIDGGSDGVKDVDGNALASDKTWTFTAASPPTSGPSIRSAADVVAAGPDGVLWNYPASGRGGFQPREKIGTGWSTLAKGFVADWNSDGVFDVIAQWQDGRLSYYAGRPGGGFVAARTIGNGWGSYHVTVGRWRKTDKYPGILAYDAAGTLWYYGNSAGSSLSPRIRTGLGWRGLYLTMTDFDQNGTQDLLAKRSDGRMLLYRSTGTGGFVSESRPTVGAGWNGINSITAVAGFTTGSSGLMTRLTDGRLARYPFSRGTWGARTIVGAGWSGYNIFR